MLVLKGGILVDPVAKTEEKKDLLIEDGRIIQMAEAGKLRMDGLSFGEEDLLLELKGKYIAPGLVDCHVHFRDPGFTEKEDIFTGARAAAAGGYTRVVMMGNTNPHPDQPETIREMLEKGKRTGIHVYTCGNVTKGMRGEELCDFRALKDAGAVLLSDDGKPILQAEIMKRTCEEARKADLMISTRRILRTLRIMESMGEKSPGRGDSSERQEKQKFPWWSGILRLQKRPVQS